MGAGLVLPDLGQMALAAAFRADQGQAPAMSMRPGLDLGHSLGIRAGLNKVLRPKTGKLVEVEAQLQAQFHSPYGLNPPTAYAICG